MAAGDKVVIATYNNLMARLRVARDKYYSGYSVGGDVGSGTISTAALINNAATWCTAVSAKSPLVYSFSTVASGAVMSQTPIDTNYTRIDAVSTCYSNCHSNCHSNCNCNCYCTSRGSD